MRKVMLGLVMVPLCLSAAAVDPPKRFLLLPESRQRELEKLLPRTDSEWFEGLKAKLVFYDETVMPKAYQIWDGGNTGVHSPSYNISASKPAEPFGNANVEFPWGRAAGLEESNTSHAVKFVVLPAAVEWWRDRLPGDDGQAYLWRFPDGTTFGEVLTVHRREKGWDVAFEVRTRTKRKGRWEPNVFRPFANHAEMAAAVRKLGSTEEKLLAALDEPATKRMRLANPHPTSVFDRTALVHDLPAANHDLVQRLLTETTWKSVLGEAWVKSGNDEGYAPTTQADFHVVPRSYAGGFVAVGQNSCMSCHDSTMKHANDFQRFLPSGQLRDWYGRVRGSSDGIFSWHPFDASCISDNGGGRPVVLNRRLIDAGLLKRYGE